MIGTSCVSTFVTKTSGGGGGAFAPSFRSHPANTESAIAMSDDRHATIFSDGVRRLVAGGIGGFIGKGLVVVKLVLEGSDEAAP
jgi:hypothetical protein